MIVWIREPSKWKGFEFNLIFFNFGDHNRSAELVLLDFLYFFGYYLVGFCEIV